VGTLTGLLTKAGEYLAAPDPLPARRSDAGPAARR
jgi:hypothetical protein